MATFPNFQPQYGAEVSVVPRNLRQKFGDGYEQIVGDGLNTKKRVWSLTFREITSNIDTIEAFLLTCSGVDAFEWTPPRGSAAKWRSTEEGWKRNVVDFGYETLSVSFEEVFYS